MSRGERGEGALRKPPQKNANGGEPFGPVRATTITDMQRGRVALRVVPAEGAESERIDEPLSLDAAFRRYSPYVAAISLRLLGRDDEVDDIVQDVFLSAVKGFQQIRDAGAAKAWLATVTVRVARRRLRMRRLKAMFG